MATTRGRRGRRWLMILGSVVAIAAVAGWFAYDRLFRRVIPQFASEEEHFKYGSIGNDGETGLPYAIWVVLPKVFPEHLPGPGGYASVGFRWEQGRRPDEAPLGFSRARVGVERMAINCAFCHITTYRREAGGTLEFALAGTSNALDVLAYQRFLAASARDPRFTPDVLLPAMAEAGIRLSWLDRQLYRYALIPAARKALREQGEAFAWADRQPSWGPGRIDPFNPVKFGLLGLPVDGTIGNSDMQAVWGLEARERLRPGAPLHWDGLNTSIREVALSSALGDGSGAKRAASWQPSVERVERFLRQVAPPPSPYRPEPAAVERGRAVFAGACGQCHAAGGERTLTVVPAAELGTDRNRLDMWTAEAAATYNDYGSRHGFGFRAFRNLEGYVAEPLDGLWLRAPYLHNGSVPTLADLLEPPDRRPSAFLRGGETLDSLRGGFIAPACAPSAPPPGAFCHDTSLPGNGHGGHLYGTDLDPQAKADLLAFLLTL